MLGFAVRYGYGDSCKVEIESYIKHFCHHRRCCMHNVNYYAFCKAGFEPGAGWTFETSITLVCNCTKWKHYESIKRIAVLCPDILLLKFRQNELFFFEFAIVTGRNVPAPAFYPTGQNILEHSRYSMAWPFHYTLWCGFNSWERKMCQWMGSPSRHRRLFSQSWELLRHSSSPTDGSLSLSLELEWSLMGSCQLMYIFRQLLFSFLTPNTPNDGRDHP